MSRTDENIAALRAGLLGMNPNSDRGENVEIVEIVIDLGAVVRGDAPPIEPGIVYRNDSRGLVYAGQVHDLHAEPGIGKTWIAMFSVAETLRLGGAVLFIDYESSPRVFVERLRALDVPDDVIANVARVAYVTPTGANTPATLDALVTLATGRLLVVIDAAGPALAREGLDENSNADVAKWHERIVRPLARAGPAVLVVDHVTKDPTTRVRGSRGASAKLQLVDVSYAASQARAFSRTTDGIIRVRCEKDRNGYYANGEVVAEIDVAPHAGGAAMLLDVRAPGEQVPTVLMERVSRFLEQRTDGASQRGVREGCTGKTTGLIWALDVLIERGHVTSDDGRYRSVRPYREGQT
jgi:KaiC/GvpD/RAD55 family RecA-like ATPase